MPADANSTSAQDYHDVGAIQKMNKATHFMLTITATGNSSDYLLLILHLHSRVEHVLQHPRQ